MMVDGKLQSHVVRFNEVLTEVTIPAPKAGFKASFEKLRPRGVWDFSMASLALGLQLNGKTIQDSRVVFGGIAGKPWREKTVEQFLQGKTTQAEFSHTLNALIDGGRQVVIAADRPPMDLESFDDRVRSRLAGGLVVEMGSLGEELRLEILISRIALARIDPPQPGLM